MLYNGIFGCHGNIFYVILINAFFFTKLTNLENMHKSYVVFGRGPADRYIDQKHFETNQKSLRHPVQK